MKETTLFTIDTPYRPALPVRAWTFGAEGKKSLAVMGALRGNEIQQMYICGRLIRALTAAEKVFFRIRKKTEYLYYFVPKIRSPQSPRPGRI